jgi:hypothetical protein
MCRAAYAGGRIGGRGDRMTLIEQAIRRQGRRRTRVAGYVRAGEEVDPAPLPPVDELIPLGRVYGPFELSEERERDRDGGVRRDARTCWIHIQPVGEWPRKGIATVDDLRGRQLKERLHPLILSARSGLEDRIDAVPGVVVDLDRHLWHGGERGKRGRTPRLGGRLSRLTEGKQKQDGKNRRHSEPSHRRGVLFG